jgi:hypothetical protein
MLSWHPVEFQCFSAGCGGAAAAESLLGCGERLARYPHNVWCNISLRFCVCCRLGVGVGI